MSDVQFLKLIKIRIGEPITAIDINDKGVCFGSISGYIGFFDFDKQQLEYINELFDELIRDINLDQNNQAYLSIGDLHGVKANFDDMNKITHNIISYGQKSHSSVTCPGNVILMNGNFGVQLTATPTQNKEIDYKYKNGQNTYLIDFQNETVSELGQIPLSQFSVPQDYNQNQILWTQFAENLSIHIYDCEKKSVSFKYEFNKIIRFISFCKIIDQDIYFVQDLVLNINTKQIKDLYKHSSTIQALCIYQNNIFVKDKENNDIELNELNQKQIQIMTIDYDCNCKIFYKQIVQQSFNILKLQNVNEIIKDNKFIFDMDYPYYLKFNDKFISFTCDFGIIVLKF